MFANGSDLPIASAPRTYNAHFLPDVEGIGSKYGYIMAHVLLHIKCYCKIPQAPAQYSSHYNISYGDYYRQQNLTRSTEQSLAFPKKEGILNVSGYET